MNFPIQQRGFIIRAISLLAAGIGLWVTITAIAWCKLVRVKPVSAEGNTQ